MKNANITELLSKLVEIPSISSLQENQKDVLDSANFIADLFNEIGLNSKVTSSKNSKPAVLAQTEIDPSKKTVLLYACLLYTSPSPRDATLSRMPSSA